MINAIVLVLAIIASSVVSFTPGTDLQRGWTRTPLTCSPPDVKSPFSLTQQRHTHPGVSNNLGPLFLFHGMAAGADVSSTGSVLTSMQTSLTWIATASADIDAMPENEFRTVFSGGLFVMFGSVLAAVFVGFMLENGNLYANVIADSYAQQGNDEEFWKGLSDEEKKKAQEMLNKAKGGGGSGPALGRADASTTTLAATTSATQAPQAPVASVSESQSTEASPKTENDLGMFSDYDVEDA